MADTFQIHNACKVADPQDSFRPAIHNQLGCLIQPDSAKNAATWDDARIARAILLRHRNVGLDKLLQEETGLPVHVAEDPLSAVAEGTGRALSEIKFLRQVASSDKPIR